MVPTEELAGSFGWRDKGEINLTSHYSFVFGTVPLDLPWFNSNHRLGNPILLEILAIKPNSFIAGISQTSSTKNLDLDFSPVCPLDHRWSAGELEPELLP
jgi:hypothetical protein